MGAGHEEDRDYLSVKFNRPVKTLGDLNALGTELFALLNSDERATDLYMTERALYDAELAAEPMYP